MRPTHTPPRIFFSRARLEAFSDGVFAIAITLLVFDLHLPGVAALSEQEVYHGIAALAPKFVSFLVSFGLIGVYWVAQHTLFQSFLHRVDRNVLWLNNLFLLGVVLVPFLAGLLGSYGSYPGVVMLYGANLVGIGTVLLWLVTYVTRDPELRIEPINWHTVSISRRRVGLAIAAYAAAIVAAMFNPLISMALYFLVPAIYILPSRFDMIWEIGHRHDPSWEETPRVE